MAGLRTLFGSLFWQTCRGEAGSGQLAHLIKSVERNTHQDLKYIELLQAYESKCDLDSAIIYLTKFVERKRNVETAYRYLLVAYKRKGDLTGLSKIIRLHPNYVAAHNWFLADAYIKSDWDAAIAVLSVLVELHPNDERWSHSLATAYDNKGDVESAVAGFNRLVELCPASSDLRQQLVYYQNKASKLGEESPGVPGAAAPIAAAAPSRNKSEFEKNLELKQKFTEIEAKDRERKEIEHTLRSRPRRLTPWEKFRGIKPRGSRDGFG